MRQTNLKKNRIRWTFWRLLFFPPPPPPTSHKHQFSGVTRSFTRLDKQNKYVCNSLISPHAKLCHNRTMNTKKLLVKIAGGVGGGVGERAWDFFEKLKSCVFRRPHPSSFAILASKAPLEICWRWLAKMEFFFRLPSPAPHLNFSFEKLF